MCESSSTDLLYLLFHYTSPGTKTLSRGVVLLLLSMFRQNLPKGVQKSGRTLHVTTQDKDFAGNSAAESGEQLATAPCQKQ